MLDAALSLEQYVDVDQPLRRERYPEYLHRRASGSTMPFGRATARWKPTRRPRPPSRKLRAPVPPHPERDLLWFIASYAPEMESWERDIFLAVREESFYFYPVFATQIMNEGWASYWHARLLREADFIPQATYLDAIKCHSDVVRPVATGEQVALTINPYHLGFTLWEQIVRKSGWRPRERSCARMTTSASSATNSPARSPRDGAVPLSRQQNGPIKVVAADIDELHESLLLDKYNFGAPRVAVAEVRNDGTLVLEHDSQLDGRGLDAERARKVLEYVKRVWRRPVLLKTVDAAAKAVEFSADSAAA